MKRRNAVCAAILALLASIAFVGSASAKAPFKVLVYDYSTGSAVAELTTEQERMDFIEALYDERRMEILPEALPSSWDYRIVAYFNAALEYPTEMLYTVPHGGELGVFYWPDALRADVPFLITSPALDELMAAYISLPPADAQGANASPLTPIAFAAVVVAAVAGAFIGLRRWLRARAS